ncbi:MAG TPA: NAD-dependent epimerase/dehydratase family protein [Usitatibacter sp.]
MPAVRSFVVTGSGGFVGSVLLAHLRDPPQRLHLAPADWRDRIAAASFEGATVVHLAARVHAPRSDPGLYETDNREKTEVLARAAARGGARRFVFLSSVKALGEETREAPFSVHTQPRPLDAYGRSKLAAERALEGVARASSMEFVVVRAPLVFGAGAAGNLRALLRLCDSPWPLPFAAVHNRRSFVHVSDLARLLLACAGAPSAAGSTYLAAHREPFSTTQLFATIRRALGRPPRLVAMSPRVLEALARIAGRADTMRRLTRSLEVDPAAAQRDLGWMAAVPLESAVEEMVAAYRAERPR